MRWLLFLCALTLTGPATAQPAPSQPPRPPLGQILNAEGNRQLSTGNPQAAAETFSRMLAFCETALPANRPHCLVAGHIGRANAWRALVGKDDDAVEDLRRALEVARTLPAPGSPRLGEAAMAMAAIMQKRQAWGTAEAFLSEALAFAATGRADPPLDQLVILQSLSEALMKQDKTNDLAALAKPVLAALVQSPSAQRIAAWPLAWRIGQAAIRANQMAEAESLIAEALASRIAFIGQHPIDVMVIRQELGIIHWHQRRWDDAATRLGEALAFAETTLGENHTRTADVLGWLARNALHAGQGAQAETFAARAMRVLASIGEQDTPRTRAIQQWLVDARRMNATSAVISPADRERRRLEALAQEMRTTANADMRAGRYAQALAAFEARLDVLITLFGENSDWVAYGRTDIIFALADLGRLDEAASRGLSVLRDLPPSANPVLRANAHNALAKIRYEQGRLAEAESECRHGLALPLDPAGDRQAAIETSALLTNLGAVLRQQGKYAEAIEFGERGVALTIQIHGAQNIQTAGSLHLLGNTYGLAGRGAEASKLRRQALDIRLQNVGDHNRYSIISLATVGNDLIAAGEFSEAEKLIERAMTATLSVYGPDHIRTAEVRETMVALRVAQGRYPEAIPELERAREAAQRAYGPASYSAISIEIRLGALLFATGRLVEAEQIQRTALESARRATSNRHPVITGYQTNLAFTLIERGQFTEATQLLRDSMAILSETQGVESPTLSQSIIGLARIALHQGEIDNAAILFARAIHLLDSAGKADWPETALARVQLAEAQLAQNNITAAATTMARVREVMEQARLAETPIMISVLRTSGFLALRENRAADAAADIDRALELTTRFKSDRGTAYATLLNDRGLAAAALSHHAEATRFFQRAVKVMESAGQASHLLTAITLINEAKSLEALGRKEDARKRHAQAQAILRHYQFVPQPRDRWI